MSQPSLLEMPENVMLKITEAVGFPSIFALRKVCRNYRNFIDDLIPNINLTGIINHVYPHRIYLYYEISGKEKTLLFYKKHSDGCVVRHNGREHIMENEEYLSVFLRDFELIIKHQKSPLEQFHFLSGGLESDRDFQQYISSIFAKTKNILKSRPRPLKVKEFAMSAFRQEHVMSILPFLDANFLTNISMEHSDYATHGKNEFMVELNEVMALAQWKNATNLKIFLFHVTEPVENFFGFTKVSIWKKSVSGNDLFLIKEKFLSSNNQTEEFTIYYQDFVDGQTLGYCFSEGCGDGNWYYQTDHYNKILSISATEWVKMVFVSFIERTEVPENAVMLIQ